MRKMQTCPCCEHYDVCNYRIMLDDLDKTLGFAVDWMDDKGFRKWRYIFARWCMYFKMDESTVDDLIATGLDFIYQSSNKELKEDG